MENRLATIVFIDMQGYTKRSAQQTIEEMKLFHDEMFNFVKTHLEKYQGIMVKTLGDGFLARFDSPTQAVQCGLEMQRRLEARNAQMLNPDSIVRFRIGINTGEIGIDEQGDVFGDPVNIASRIQSYAEPNEVYISESTFLAMNRNEVGAQDLGPQMFKNATREIRIYKILKQGSPGLVLPAAGTRAGGKAAEESGSPPAKISASPLKTWLTIGIGLFVGAMFLTGVKHTFKRSRQSQPTPPSGQLAAPSFAPSLAPDMAPGMAPETAIGTAQATVSPPPVPPPPAERPPLPLKPPAPVTPVPSPVKPTRPSAPPTTPPQPEPDQPGNTGHPSLPPGGPVSALDIDPDNPPAHLNLNQNQKTFLKGLKKLYKAGLYDEAVKLAEAQEPSVKQAPPPKQVDFYVLLGELYLHAGKKEQSQAAFEKARQNIGPGPLRQKMLEMRIMNIQRKPR